MSIYLRHCCRIT